MSKASIILNNLGPSRVKAVAALRKVLGLPMSEITTAVGTGRPVDERTLFGPDEAPFAHRLVQLMEELEALGADFEVFEVLEGQTLYGTKDTSKYWEITVDRLRNRIRAHEKSLRKLRGGG